MSKPDLSIIIVCVLLVLAACIISTGCTMPRPGSGGTPPAASSAMVTESLVTTPPLQSGQSAGDLQLTGNVYGLSSDPKAGIDTVTFSIGLPAHASSVDLTGMVLVFSTEKSAPVTLLQGTRETTALFTTTIGGNPVTALDPGDEVDVSFRVKPVSGGTRINIDVKPPDRSTLSLPRTVPAMITSLNVM